MSLMKEDPGHFGVMVVGMRYTVTLKQAAGSLFWSFMLTLRYIKGYSM